MKDVLEKCHLKFLRYSLGVNKKAPKLAVYGDTGRFPLALESIISAVKYLQRLFNLSSDENQLLQNAFMECQNLKSKKSWFNNLSSLLKKCDITMNMVASHDGSIIAKKIKIFLQNEFIKGWKSELFSDARRGDHGNKLRTYRSFKTSFVKEDYLTECHVAMHRQKFASLRLSAHKLQIEMDRYTSKNRLPPKLRICKICDLGECEDEMHFVMKCPRYSVLHHELFVKIIELYPFFATLNDDTKFIWLMANADGKIIRLFSAYIFSCFAQRKKLMGKTDLTAALQMV